MLLVTSCQHTPKVGPLPENKEGTEQFIVEEGDSSQAVYSSGGDKLLFVSHDRPSHKQAQVYEKDLKTGIERRITFQNGTTMHPRYSPHENAILYASSTDELKENPPLLRGSEEVSKLPSPYQEPMEIYLHSLRELEITRLTEHLGFDGEAQFSSDGKEVTWTRVNNQHTEVVAYNRTSRSMRVLRGLGENPSQYVVSPDGKTRAWIEWDTSFGVSRLRVQKGNAKAVEVGTDMIVHKTDLSFTPDSKWLVWAQKDSTLPVYDLWTLDIANLCVRRLTTSREGERRDPTVSPDLKWLTYTYNRNERSRIARAAFQPPTATCSPAL